MCQLQNHQRYSELLVCIELYIFPLGEIKKIFLITSLNDIKRELLFC